MVQIFNLLILYRRPALPPSLKLRPDRHSLGEGGPVGTRPAYAVASPFSRTGVRTFGNFVRSGLPQRYIPTRRPNRGGLGL